MKLGRGFCTELLLVLTVGCKSLCLNNLERSRWFHCIRVWPGGRHPSPPFGSLATGQAQLCNPKSRMDHHSGGNLSAKLTFLPRQASLAIALERKLP